MTALIWTYSTSWKFSLLKYSLSLSIYWLQIMRSRGTSLKIDPELHNKSEDDCRKSLIMNLEECRWDSLSVCFEPIWVQQSVRFWGKRQNKMIISQNLKSRGAPFSFFFLSISKHIHRHFSSKVIVDLTIAVINEFSCMLQAVFRPDWGGTFDTNCVIWREAGGANITAKSRCCSYLLRAHYLLISE